MDALFKKASSLSHCFNIYSMQINYKSAYDPKSQFIAQNKSYDFLKASNSESICSSLFLSKRETTTEHKRQVKNPGTIS